MSLIPVLVLALLVTAPGRAAVKAPRDPFADDPRLVRKVAVTAEGMPMGDLLALLAEKSGVSLAAGAETADDKLLVFGPARPLRDLLGDMAALLGDTWTRRKPPDGAWVYHLERGAATRQNEARLARAEIERMQAQLAAQVRALDETPAQLARRPENDPIRRLLQDPRSSSRTGTLLYSWLSPQQRELFFDQHRLRLPPASFTPDQEVAIRKEYDGMITREAAAANQYAAENPGHAAQFDRPADLDRFGITFSLSRQGGRTLSFVRLGNGGHAFLAELENIQGFLLPAHGNPYTGAMVAADAALPPATVTEAVTRDLPWPDRLRKLSTDSHLPVLADYYRTPPLSTPPETAPGGASPASAAALDSFCQRDGYLWWSHGGTLLLRKRDWYQQRLREVPDRWLLRLIARLKAQNGVPTYADLQLLQELTLRQLTGLALMADRGSADDLAFLGLHELLELIAAAPHPQQGPLPIGDLRFISSDELERRVSLVQERLAPRQQPPFTRLLVMRDGPLPLEALGGETITRCYCLSPKAQVTERGYHFIDVGVWLSLHKWTTPEGVFPRVGNGYAANYDLHLPLSLPDDRRDRTRVEVIPVSGPSSHPFSPLHVPAL